MWQSVLEQRSPEFQVPIPWDLGITPLRGQLVMVLGSPGIGKSYFALRWALAAMPSVVLSLDTDLATQATRAAGFMFGASFHEVESNPEFWGLMLEQKAQGCRMYDRVMDPRDLLDLVVAETQFWGRPPNMVVIDNLANMLPEVSYERVRGTMIGLQKVARLADTCVVVLHHTKREAGFGPLSMYSGQYGGEAESEIMLGLWKQYGEDSNFQLGVLKNRSGAHGQTFEFLFQPAQSKLEMLYMSHVESVMPDD
jgi:hypothetical protein